jgi:hypothetical protein
MRLAVGALVLLSAATSAVAQPDLAAEIARGAGAVGLSSSEAPAVRVEARTGQPSPGFLLGAAYRAWVNAASVLAFDLVNPTAGPPHASQNGQLSEFIREECREEATAFDALTQRMPLGWDIGRVISAAGGDAADAKRWADRKAGPAAACR